MRRTERESLRHLGGPRLRGHGVGWRAAFATSALSMVGLAACKAPVQPQPPGGGVKSNLDYAFFVTRVEPILGARDCTRTTGCHGGQGAGQFRLSQGNNPAADFIATRPLTNELDPPSSPLLRKPLALAAGGTVHGGGAIFADTSDADYRTIMRWVAGEKAP